MAYHRSEGGGSEDKTKGFDPRFAGGNAVNRSNRKGPLDKKLEPNKTHIEMGFLGD